MTKSITSKQNVKIKAARGLRRRKNRQESQKYLVEGIAHVGAAFESGAPIDHLLYAPGLLTSEFARDLITACTDAGIPCYSTTEQVFESLASKEGPQGILAVVRQQPGKLDQTAVHPGFFGVGVHEPQDPGNVGTILRTLDAVGATGLFLLDGGVDPYHPTAVRASMGALFRIPITRASSADFIRWSEAHQVALYGSSAQGAADYLEIKEFAWPAALVLGSERSGLPPEILNACRKTLRLPMAGSVTSLNLSVAAGVLLYHMQAQRNR